MSRCMYDGKRIIPAPFVNVNKEYQKNADGEIVGSQFVLTITGTLVAYKGSPDSSGNFWTSSGYPNDEVIDSDARLGALFRKKEALRDLFSVEGKQLEFQSMDGSQPMKCNPRITNIAFQEGLWFNRVNYTITCEADVLSVNGIPIGEDAFSEYISSASESWAFETNEDLLEGENGARTYRITHTVSAVGKRFYDETGALEKAAWEQARDNVLPRLGLDSVIMLSSGVNNLPSYYSGYNHVRNENIDKQGGTYSVVETWLIASGSALEDFTVSVRNTSEDGLTRVSIEGTITGLESRDSNFNIVSTKYENANSKFSAVSGVLITRAQQYSDESLNVIPNNRTVGRNPITGVITYAFEYDNRPSNVVPNAKSEVIAINDSWNVDVFAAITVLGRAAGPVLQDLNTKQAATRSLNIELVMPPASFGGGTVDELKNAFNNQKPRFNLETTTQLQNIYDAANPANNGAVKTLISNQSENWEPKTGRYSYQVEWTYEE